MKIYYAHHQWKYNTKIEDYEIELIKAAHPGCEIVNPNGALDQTKPEVEIMEDCFGMIKDCDRFVFSTLSGTVGKGVCDEVGFAYSWGLPIEIIERNGLHGITVPRFEPMNSGSNRTYANVTEAH